MGQNTATSKIEKNVMVNEIQTALVQLYQYLNSGNLRANGLEAGKYGMIMTVGIRVHKQKIEGEFQTGVSPRTVRDLSSSLIYSLRCTTRIRRYPRKLSNKPFPHLYSSVLLVGKPRSTSESSGSNCKQKKMWYAIH